MHPFISGISDIKLVKKSGNPYADILFYGGRQMMRIPVYLIMSPLKDTNLLPH